MELNNSGLSEKDHWFFYFTPVLKLYLQNASSSTKELDMTFREKFSKYYTCLINDIYNDINNENPHLPSVRYFEIVKDGLRNDFDKAIHLSLFLNKSERAALFQEISP